MDISKNKFSQKIKIITVIISDICLSSEVAGPLQIQTMHKKTEAVEYYNSGCWTDKPSNFISINSDGKIYINLNSEVMNFREAS